MHTLEQGDLKVEFVQIFSFITSVNDKSTETVLKFHLHLSEKLKKNKKKQLRLVLFSKLFN